MGIANDMGAKFGGKLDVKIHTLNSPEARPFALEFKGSTNVRFNDEWVPLGVALDKDRMEAFLSEKMHP